MVRRRPNAGVQWPVWLREFEPAGWDGDTLTEQLESWRTAAMAWHRATPSSVIVGILQHTRRTRRKWTATERPG